MRLQTLKPRANGLNIVECYMLLPFAHPVECCCMLLRVAGRCCAKLETGQTFSHLQTDTTTPNTVGPTMLGVVASVSTQLNTGSCVETKIGTAVKFPRHTRTRAQHARCLL